MEGNKIYYFILLYVDILVSPDFGEIASSFSLFRMMLTVGFSYPAFSTLRYVPLIQWFSTSLMLQPFNTIPYIVVNPNFKIMLLLLHNYNFVTFMNLNVNI